MNYNLIYNVAALGIITYVIDEVLASIGKEQYIKKVNIVTTIVVLSQIIIMIIKVFKATEVFLIK